MPSASDLDFWLGTWNVRWGPAETDRGRNVITRTFGGYVVEERFDGRPGIELQGMSVSVFDEHRGLWRQTWVDDSGTYFALEGGVEGDEFVLVGRDHNAAEELRSSACGSPTIASATRSRGAGSARSTGRRPSRNAGASPTSAPRAELHRTPEAQRREKTRRWLLQ